MSQARSIRRAAERRAQKLARKQGQPALAPQTLSAEPEAMDIASSAGEMTPAEITPAATSPARRQANRANAQLSTGPTSAEGKAKSSQNALKTALTGRTVLLPSDDAERYACRLAEYNKLYRPVGIRETEIVQALCDTWWRLERIPGLLDAIYAKGCQELLAKVPELDGQVRDAMLRAETYLLYERQIRNLEIQERRLFRQADHLKAELSSLRKEREEREAEELSHAAMFYLTAKKDRRPFDPADYGFEFSTADVEAFLEGQRARQIAEQAAKNGQIAPQILGKTA